MGVAKCPHRIVAEKIQQKKTSKNEDTKYAGQIFSEAMMDEALRFFEASIC
jgi:hypothetical protein